MVSIATIGPEGSHAWQAARQYNPDATIRLFPNLTAVFKAFAAQETDLALAPVYNTREGQVKEYSRLVKGMDKGFWQDNIVLPIHLSLGSLSGTKPITMLLGKSGVLRQCE
ncbi:MAG: prephenate dehydratase domain-containing protein, partial [Desulfurivibrionaceae bacterium]